MNTMAKKNTSVVFRAAIHRAEGGNATGIVVPADIIDRLGAGQRPPVQVTLNGHTFRTTIGVMAGKHSLPISAQIRNAAGVAAGDTLDVELVVDSSPREVVLPGEFAKALNANPDAAAFFSKLSNSLQRYHVDTINDAKTDETRTRRIDKAVALFLADKPR